MGEKKREEQNEIERKKGWEEGREKKKKRERKV